MGTTIRPELSTKNKYWIEKHRYYELKHYCLQYPLWKKAYTAYSDVSISSPRIGSYVQQSGHSDKTSNFAVMAAFYKNKLIQLEAVAQNTDYFLGHYILKAVTEGLSFTYLSTKLDMPCSRDMYYDRYRKFFWLLDQIRD